MTALRDALSACNQAAAWIAQEDCAYDALCCALDAPMAPLLNRREALEKEHETATEVAESHAVEARDRTHELLEDSTDATFPAARLKIMQAAVAAYAGWAAYLLSDTDTACERFREASSHLAPLVWPKHDPTACHESGHSCPRCEERAVGQAVEQGECR